MQQLKMFSNELQAKDDMTNEVYIYNNLKMKDNSQTNKKTNYCRLRLIHNKHKRKNQTSYNHRS